ncbi:Serine/threonine-protein kinase PknA [Enhygromyxa salina]|uniref:Serine/threonine-protein kinase PknA n=1 Tax=Enhygromyxa salina TaxID=215803 RepID=A0A2S9XRQ3_9BACT|nr:serine/threonine-protein kinase [Enhygromyxa salina]PRP95543.1 Serine/threonine-protein kinase PknA [Enhygromyxa salina]
MAASGDNSEVETSRPVTREDSNVLEPDAPTPTAAAPPKGPPPPRERGETVGRYVVVDTIGRGGMGVVYAAWDPQLDRRVALKLVFIGAELGTDGDTQRARLLREAQALARLEHPNVVKVHDVGVCEGQVFIAMEHIEGQSLRAWLSHKRRTLREILTVFVAAGRGLAASHDAGLVHRDFKPDNVLVGASGEVKVVDFGLARDRRSDDRPRTREWADTEPAVARALARAGSGALVRSSPPDHDAPEPASKGADSGPLSSSGLPSPGSREPLASPSITVTGAVLGTPAYMAPEQHELAAVDARSDQYAFCVSLWEAVYGKRPFSGRRSELLAKRKRKLQIRESSRGLRVPKWLRSLMLRGLSPHRRRRFADMDQVLTELEVHLNEWRRRARPAVIGLVAAAALAGSVAVAKLVDADEAPCAAPVERLAGVWDSARRAEVEAAILASDLAYADASWRRVAAGLDEYEQRWLAASVEVCEATHVHAQRNTAWLEQRLACLEDRRRELAGLTAQLARSDARTVELATRAVGSLAPIDACLREQASELTPLPSAPHLRVQVTHQLDELARARAELGSGHLEQGLAAAREVLRVARELGWAPLEAEALFVIGSRQADLDHDLDAQLATLHQAASVALREDHQRLAVRSWSRLARALVRARELDQAERWLAYADALASSLALSHGPDPALAADLLHARAQLRFAEQDFAGAEALARERLDLLRGFYGDDNPRVADGLNNLGVAVYMQHRKDEAVDAYREALAILAAVHGPDHPSVATMHNNIGVVSTDRHAYPDALAHYRRAVEIRRRVYPPAHELVLQSEVNLANLYLFSGDPGPGVALALEVLTRVGERTDAKLARARDRDADEAELAAIRVELVPELLRLGRLLAGAGQHHNALSVFGRARALLEAVPDARLAAELEAPPGDGAPPRPPHLDGCRADVLMGIEDQSRALGRSHDAAAALATRSTISVQQPAWPRRCLDQYGRWAQSREREP